MGFGVSSRVGPVARMDREMEGVSSSNVSPPSSYSLGARKQSLGEGVVGDRG